MELTLIGCIIVFLVSWIFLRKEDVSSDSGDKESLDVWEEKLKDDFLLNVKEVELFSKTTKRMACTHQLRPYSITGQRTLILKNLDELIVDSEKYLVMWKREGGGTKGHAIGSLIENLKKKRIFFKSYC